MFRIEQGTWAAPFRAENRPTHERSKAMVWNLKNPVLKGSVTVTVAGRGTTVVEVSTSSIPNSPETCLFWGGTARTPQRGSSVVETYADWDEARLGHAKWLNDPFAVAQAMVDAGWNPR